MKPQSPQPLLRRPPKRRSRVVERLKREIVDGLLPPGAQMPTRRDLRDRFGVSIATVDSAMAQLVNEGFIVTRGTVGTFVADHPTHLTRFALVFPHDPKRFVSRFYAGLADAARRANRPEQGLTIDCCFRIDSQDDTAEFKQLLDAIKKQRLAGLIFSGPPTGLWKTPILTQPGIPRVLVAASSMNGLPAVYPDLPAFFDRALATLLTQNKRRIALLAPSMAADSHRASFEKFAKKHNLPALPWLMQFIDFQCKPAAIHAVDLLMRLPENQRPDALFVVDDNLVENVSLAVALLDPARRAGLEVLAMVNRPLPPPIYCPLTALGFDTARLLATCLERLAQQRAGQTPETLTLFEPEFFEVELSPLPA